MGASQSSSDYDEPEHGFEEEEEEERDDDADFSSGAAVDRLYPDGTVEEFEEEATNGRVMSLRLGALDHSFLVNDTGVQVYRNFNHGLHGKGVFLKFDDGKLEADKAILMKVETDMMLMSQMKEGRAQASNSLHQLDIESGKIVKEWKFEKDGVDITMRDITNDTKGSQLDPSNSTFLGLADNILCQWDMRHREGMVQSIAAENSPALYWNHGYLFSRGTNFKCFVTSGDGSIFVGSVDGRIRLYSKKSIWQSKTIFPGLGSPITKVDVTFDGKWVLGTTDTYLILICTLLADKDWETEEEGFTERMPILLKLSPQDSYLAGTNKFHGGHFSWVTKSGIKEPHIVASVANFSVIWSFQQVKNSVHGCYRNHQKGLKSCYCYMIVMKDESIVESQFMHHNFADSDSLGAPLVVATPMKVGSFKLCLDWLFRTDFTV